MFVPRPQTTHVPRSYTTQTTRKTLNKDKENANALPSKTPSRAVGAGKMLVPNTARVGLGAKSVGGKNVEGKGKGKEVDDIGPKRLFASTSTTIKANIVPSKSFSNLQPIKQTAKTPARQNLRTPAPPVFQAQATPLPSASKPRRSRRSGSTSLTPAGLLPAPLTPAPKQWEEGESLGSISEGLNELALGTSLDGVMEEEDDGEPEYMPPRAIPLPYEPLGAPPGVMDELKALTLLPGLWLMRSDEELPPPAPAPEEVNTTDWSKALDRLDDEELEEPMFRIKKVAPEIPRSNAVKTASSLTVRPTQTPSSRLAGPSSSSARPASRSLASSTLRHVSSSSRLAPSTRTPITRPTPAPARTSSSRPRMQPTPAPVKVAPVVQHTIPADLMDDIPELPDLILDFSLDDN